MGFLRRLYVGERPEPTPDPIPAGPRPLTAEDIAAWQDAASHRTGQATWSEMQFVLERLTRSDPVRVWRIRHDMHWLARKANLLGLGWNDLTP